MADCAFDVFVAKYRALQDLQWYSQKCLLLNFCASRAVHRLQLGGSIGLFQNLWGYQWTCLPLGPWTSGLMSDCGCQESKATYRVFSGSLETQEFLQPGPCSSRAAWGQWLRGGWSHAQDTLRVSGGTNGHVSCWFLAPADCSQTVAVMGWGPVKGPIQDLQSDWVWWTYLQGSQTMVESDWSLFPGHFRDHSPDRVLEVCYLIHVGHESSRSLGICRWWQDQSHMGL